MSRDTPSLHEISVHTKKGNYENVATFKNGALLLPGFT